METLRLCLPPGNLRTRSAENLREFSFSEGVDSDYDVWKVVVQDTAVLSTDFERGKEEEAVHALRESISLPSMRKESSLGSATDGPRLVVSPLWTYCSDSSRKKVRQHVDTTHMPVAPA